MRPPGGPGAARLVGWGQRHDTLLAIGFYAILILVLLWSSLVGGKVLSAGDQVLFQPTFAQERPASLVHPSNADLADPVQEFGPDLWRMRQSLEHGSLPLWNPNVGAGRPLLASQQQAPLFPTQWLAFVLPFWTAFAYIVALKLLAAAIGTYLFCRALGFSWGPRLLAGTAFAFSSYLFSWIQHPLTNAWILLPWLFLAARTVCRRGRPLDVLGLSALVGVLLFAGHPESELVVLVALAGWTVFELWGAHRQLRLDSRTCARRGGLIALAVWGGLMLSAVVTIPFLEFLGQGYPDPRGGPPPSASIIASWIFPEFWGRPDKLYEASSHSYQEWTVYIGTLPLLLGFGGLGARPWRRTQLFFAALAALALAIALPTPVNSLVRALPGMNYIALTRVLVMATFAGAVLAGYGLQRLIDGEAREQRRVLRAISILGALPLLWLLWHFIDHHSFAHWTAALRQLPTVGYNETSAQVVELAAVWRWIVFALLGIGGLALLARLGTQRGVAMVCFAVALTAVDLITLNHGYQPAIPQALADPPAPAAVRYVQVHAAGSRVMGASVTFTANLADRYGVLDPREYDFPASDRYERLFTALGGGGPDRPVVEPNDPQFVRLADLFATRYVLLPFFSSKHPNGLEVNPGALPRSWVAYSWRSVKGQAVALFDTVSATPRQSEATPVIEGAQPPPTGPSPPPTPARLTKDGAEEVQLQVTAQRAGYLILDDSYFPGWHATVDGHPQPILAANENFRAVPISAGRHVITFHYQPASVTAGAAISIATAIAMAVLGAFLWMRRRHQGFHPAASRQTGSEVRVENHSLTP